MHDPEAVRCIVTTLRTIERDDGPDAEEQAAAILSALSSEGMHVTRGRPNA